MNFPTPLVSAQWLKRNLDNPNLRLIDCRFSLANSSLGHGQYTSSHLPGAVFLDLEYDLSAPKNPDGKGGRHPKPDPEILATKLGSMGIGNEHFVVAYDDPPAGGMYAPHMWWLLRWLGHDRVAVLDGGIKAWGEIGGALTAQQPEHPHTNFIANVRSEMVLDVNAVINRSNHTVLIDSRAPERYRGEVEPLDRAAGHIPGAINRNWAESLDSTGKFKTPDAQAARFENLEGEIIAYCGSGVSATANILALELAGKKAKLYAGSWSDWVSEGSRPVATGEK